ncbi:hypothetical protein L596_023078 [Steinernema carpocapsae]|uniref:Secreted protein n=1 Tax=Steinernema carpocapsae TaxID=34508 RepID=A0A4U5MCL6_STECR|nr:hypothetical protein L596_023078 [Steinernema carpocapsae]
MQSHKVFVIVLVFVKAASPAPCAPKPELVGAQSKEGDGFGLGFFHVRAIAISLVVGLPEEFLSFSPVRLDRFCESMNNSNAA